MLRGLIAQILLPALASCDTPQASPVAHDNPIMFGEASAPVEIVIWRGLRREQPKAFITTVLPGLIDGALKASPARVRLEPNVAGTCRR